MEGSRWTSIGAISELVTKGTTPTSVGFKFTDTGVNFIKVETISLDGRFIPEKFAHIDDSCHKAFAGEIRWVKGERS